ncbi:MAG: hypothetical protein J1F64_02655 [Oscillospiraceae bacterium]|nr:hypothetical protein [Oscillospiraceae bacterium]
MKNSKKFVSIFAIISVICISLAACQSSNTVQTGGDTQTNANAQEYKYGKVDIPVPDGSLCGALQRRYGSSGSLGSVRKHG